MLFSGRCYVDLFVVSFATLQEAYSPKVSLKLQYSPELIQFMLLNS
jgi:hypothetical protein